jgi:hypothetical protein
MRNAALFGALSTLMAGTLANADVIKTRFQAEVTSYQVEGFSSTKDAEAAAMKACEDDGNDNCHLVATVAYRGGTFGAVVEGYSHPKN